MNREIALIMDVDRLAGTDYFEFLPGKYSGNCWNKDSVFLDEAAFTLIESPFEKIIEDYDHYSFTEINRLQTDMIIHALQDLRSAVEKATKGDIQNSLKMLFSQTHNHFTDNFEENKIATVKMIDDLVAWLEKTQREVEYITILGL